MLSYISTLLSLNRKVGSNWHLLTLSAFYPYLFLYSLKRLDSSGIVVAPAKPRFFTPATHSTLFFSLFFWGDHDRCNSILELSLILKWNLTLTIIIFTCEHRLKNLIPQLSELISKTQILWNVWIIFRIPVLGWNVACAFTTPVPPPHTHKVTRMQPMNLLRVSTSFKRKVHFYFSKS